MSNPMVPVVDGKETDLEKFAELIVKECIDTAFHKGHPDLEFLLKHFGVEE
jgi:ribonuclease D